MANWIQRFLTAITTHKGDVAAHHAKTPNPTKEFFADAGNGSERSDFYGHPGYRINASGEEAEIGFYVPHDFTSIIAAVVVIFASATATHRLDFVADYGAQGETGNTHHETLYDQDYIMTINVIYELDISGILSSLAAGDYVGIDVSTLGVNTADLGVLGVRFRYS